MRLFVLRVAAVALAILALPSAADAAWLAPFSGNSQTVLPSPRADGVINFAVYQTEDADFTNDFGSGFDAAVRTLFGSISAPAGSYVYFYQVVNTNPVTPESSLLSLFVTPGPIFGAGTADGYVFDEAGTPVGPSPNTRLGPGVGPNDLVVNGVPSEAGFPPTGFQANGGANNVETFDPDTAFPGGPPETPAYQFVFGTTPVGGYTSVMFLVSSASPVYRRGTLQDGGYTDGDIPVPSPEPGTLALLGLGLPLLGWGYSRRLRAAKAVAEAVQ